MSRLHWLIPALLAVLGAPASPAYSEQGDEYDQLVGRWRLVVSRSTYSPGPAPTSETRTYVRDGSNILGIIERVFQDGRRERIEYTANFDREYPVLGTDAYDHVILKRIDKYTAEAVLSHAGRVFGTARRVISEDGKSMTIWFSTDGTAGATVRNVAYYEMLEPPDPALR